MTRASRSTLARVRGSAFALCVALMPALALPQSAMAQTADQIFEQGLQAYDRSDFARAAVLFQQSCDGGATSAGTSTPAPPVLSSGDAAAQTRDRYRTAHCQMPGSSGSSAVCR